MIRQDSVKARLMQICKSFTLSAFCLPLALLILFLSASLFINGVKPVKVYNTVDKAYLLTLNQRPGAPARIIPIPIETADRRPFAEKMLISMLAWGNDTANIDWKPAASLFEPRVISLMSDFRSALASISPKPVLTTAATWGFLAVRPAADLLMVPQKPKSMMTFEVAAPWPGCLICRGASSL